MRVEGSQGQPAYQAAQPCFEAYQRIKFRVRQTPLDFSPWLSQMGQCRAFLKMESEQHTGSFKARGAVNKMLCLNSEEMARGVVTCSTGNHALAFVYACGVTPAARQAATTIYLPTTASPAKVDKLIAQGANVVQHGEDCVQSEAEARRVAEAGDRVYVSPYNDAEVIAGQGTIAVELLSQLPDGVDVCFIPVGGGGLIAGMASVLKTARPSCRVVGCQPANSDVMRRSVAAGHIVDAPSQPTLSDATAGGIERGAMTLQPCMEYVDEWVSVSELEIADAMCAVLQHHSKLIEGSAACAVAAFFRLRHLLAGSNVVILCCGGNVALPTLKKVLDMGNPERLAQHQWATPSSAAGWAGPAHQAAAQMQQLQIGSRGPMGAPLLHTLPPPPPPPPAQGRGASRAPSFDGPAGGRRSSTGSGGKPV